MDFLGESGLTRLWEHITSKLATKVNKVNGMGLSSNDYTTEEKEKLANIDTEINALIDSKGYQTVDEINALIDAKLGVIESGSY